MFGYFLFLSPDRPYTTVYPRFLWVAILYEFPFFFLPTYKGMNSTHELNVGNSATTV